jgi:hypothetical protein
MNLLELRPFVQGSGVHGQTVLDEQLDVAGIVVPGMLKGSPRHGARTPYNYDRYRVLARGHDGTTTVYERH